jgi:hypothetical protein
VCSILQNKRVKQTRQEKDELTQKNNIIVLICKQDIPLKWKIFKIKNKLKTGLFVSKLNILETWH